MSEESKSESEENQQELQVNESVHPDFNETAPNAKEPYVDQELAEEYGWTPQQAREARLYL